MKDKVTAYESGTAGYEDFHIHAPDISNIYESQFFLRSHKQIIFNAENYPRLHPKTF